MSIYTNAEIQAQYLPLNINRKIPGNLNLITVQRPNNSIRIWDLIDSYITNNISDAGKNLYNTSDYLTSERTLGLVTYDLTINRGVVGSEEATLSLDASSGRVGINATPSETFGTLHIKSNAAGSDSAVLSAYDSTNTVRLMTVVNDGRVRMGTYGLNTHTATSTGTANSGYLAGFSTDGTIIEIDSSTFGGTGTTSNYAITSLAATDDRTHTWNAHTQSEVFTTGAFNQTFTNGTQVSTVANTAAGINYSVVSGTSTSSVLTSGTLYAVSSTDTGTGHTSSFAVQDTGIYFGLSTTPVLINAYAGELGKTFTSHGNSLTPSWQYPSAYIGTTRTDADLTLNIFTHSLVVVHTNTGRTITLPVAPETGNSFTIKQYDTTGTIIDGGTKFIDDPTSTTYTLPSSYQSVTVTYDGVNWVIT